MMTNVKQFFKCILLHWKSFAIVFIPIVLSPLLTIDGTPTFRCAYVALVMALFWMLELLPLPVTALIPVAVFPMLGIMSTNETAMCYMKDTCMLYLGGLMLAIAIEDCNLHNRISLYVLRIVGTSPRCLLLGFMLSTAFLSMWISDTATCAMMIPILLAVLDKVISVPIDPENLMEVKTPNSNNIRAMLCLSVSIASNIGGTATTVGTGPNIVLMGFIQQFKDQPLAFGSWLGFSLPQMLMCLFTAWIILQTFYLPIPFITHRSKEEIEIEKDKNHQISKMIDERCQQLGNFSYKEIAVSTVFWILILLWFFREPGFVPGWAEVIGGKSIKDGTPAILVGILLFVLPTKPNFCRIDSTYSPPTRGLVTWSVVEKKIPWGVILLFGGGFALAEGCTKSGLSDWIGNQLIGLSGMNEWALLFIISGITAVLTQIVSNVTTAAIIIPIVLKLATKLVINPVLLLVPPTLVCSHGFVLPVSSAPNAMIFAIAGIKSLEMAKVGITITMSCLLIVNLSIMSYGYVMFDLGTFPEWANSTITS